MAVELKESSFRDRSSRRMHQPLWIALLRLFSRKCGQVRLVITLKVFQTNMFNPLECENTHCNFQSISALSFVIYDVDATVTFKTTV